MSSVTSHNEDLWIFGYGSILWKVDFPYIEQQTADITGWSRRFWQGSVDHRGVPGNPGRVVTLVESANQVCRGIAYRLGAEALESTLAHLDFRERGGYERLQIELSLNNGKSVPGITYFADEHNRNYLGDADIDVIAKQVATASGRSGRNSEYVYELETALEVIDAQDPHVTDIANHLRLLER